MTFHSPSLTATDTLDAATPSTPRPARTYGSSEEGNWGVYVDGSNPHGISWGPFATRTDAVEFMEVVNPVNMFAVNLTDLPNFFNV